MGVAKTKVTLSGTLADGLDVWSTGWSCFPIISPTLTMLEDLALSAATEFSDNYWTPLRSTIPESVAWNTTKVSCINAAGVTTLSGEYTFATPFDGLSSGAAMPPECAVVASLRTGVPGGRYRGRMFLPPFHAAVLTNAGQLETAHRDAVASAVALALSGWNAVSDSPDAAVASDAGEFSTVITQVRVGNVVDAQRRRRNAIPEAYYISAV